MPWTSWLLVLSPAIIGLAFALKFWFAHGADSATAAAGEDVA